MLAVAIEAGYWVDLAGWYLSYCSYKTVRRTAN